MGEPEEIHAIISKIKAGDTNAFEDIVARYERSVFRKVSRHVPPEHVASVAHDTFIEAFRSLSTLKDPAAIHAWLLQIAVRSCYNFWRKRYRSKETPISSLSDDHTAWLETRLASEASTMREERDQQQHAHAVLAWALQHLSAEDRMVITLTVLEDHSVREASKILGLSVANVKVRAFRARKRLRTLIEKKFESES